MRYLVIDDRGNQRESFDSQAELLAELAEIFYDQPSALESFFVLTLDDDGREVAPARRADEILAVSRPDGAGVGFVFDFVASAVVPFGAAHRSPAASPEHPNGGVALAGSAR